MMMILIGLLGLLTLVALAATTLMIARQVRVNSGELKLRWLRLPALVLAVGAAAVLTVAVGYPKYLIWQQEQDELLSGR